MRRSGKFYRTNEKEVMKSLGLQPTPNSGSGWIVKEDGQNEQIICQLKSTDAQSISISQKDIRILEDNALTTHKLPMFAIQFLNTNEVFLLVRPEHITSVGNYIETGEVIDNDIITGGIDWSSTESISTVNSKIIKSSEDAREQFHKERENKYKKEKKAW
jgi:hypothetical protein